MTRFAWLTCSSVACSAAVLGIGGIGWGELTALFVGAVILGSD